MAASYAVAHYAEIPAQGEPEPGSYVWKPVRNHFGIRSFGVNLMVGPNEGDWVSEEHTESDTRHEELFFVASGRALFSVAGEEVEAAAGTFVYVPDPDVVRSAKALEPGTTVLAVGGEPGAAYSVSKWEREELG